jgi:hypothetical protein
VATRAEIALYSQSLVRISDTAKECLAHWGRKVIKWPWPAGEMAWARLKLGAGPPDPLPTNSPTPPFSFTRTPMPEWKWPRQANDTYFPALKVLRHAYICRWLIWWAMIVFWQKIILLCCGRWEGVYTHQWHPSWEENWRYKMRSKRGRARKASDVDVCVVELFFASDSGSTASRFISFSICCSHVDWWKESGAVD